MDNPVQIVEKKFQELGDKLKREILYVCERTFRRETVRLELSRLVTLETEHGTPDEAAKYQRLVEGLD